LFNVFYVFLTACFSFDILTQSEIINKGAIEEY